MKPLSNILILYRSNTFRNISIVLGIFLSVFLINSFNVGDSSNLDSSEQVLLESVVGDDDEKVSEARLEEKYSAKYHNFLASYFLQESSVERSKKKTEEKRSLFSNLKDFHHVILSRKWSPL
jgi:hypothetical protein